MTQTLSEVLGVDSARFAATGAFDCFRGIDARLHIDPHLLAASASRELHDAQGRFDAHFEGVLHLLLSAKQAAVSDPFFRQTVQRLTFHELPNTGLGYAKNTKRGSAIGGKLAADIAHLGKAIVDAGIVDPEIFALMGILQDGIGADRISDMTAALILPCLLQFSQRVAAELDLPTTSVTRGDVTYQLPVLPTPRETIVLVPRDILRHLPIASDWSDIDTVSAHNDDLRARVNDMIGATWADAMRVPKRKLREAILRYPELLKELLADYKAKPAVPYDFDSDPDSLYQWHPVAREAAQASPLHLQLAADADYGSIVAVVRDILHQFKRLVESNRLGRLLYNDDGTPRREKAAQLALFGIADSYCRANNLDLSPEADSGNGPVDFKFSRGYRGRVLAEVKKSSSSKLRQGFENQVRAYVDAEQAYHAFYVVVRVDNTEQPINDLRGRVSELRQSGSATPELVIVDARPSPSASVRG